MNSWIILQFIVDILLLSIIVFYIIKDSLPGKRDKKTIPNLKELSALTESLRQLIIESEKIANRLERYIEEEKRLGKEMQYGLDKKSEELNLTMQRAESILKGLKEFQNATDIRSIPLAQNPTNTAEDKYDDIFRLLEKGLSRKEIAEKIGISEGEVELISHLRR
ncbi:MAG: DUF2802 domain-containing protein [Nitrospinae bacterium]|nr:DUF2802 domain-containing protein [Nitrospinota bacterium]